MDLVMTSSRSASGLGVGSVTGFRGAERGSAVPGVVGIIGVAGLVAIGLGHVAQAMVEQARVEAAADAAALAGVVEGEVGAADLAQRNGAELRHFEAGGGGVTVVVVRGRARAVAAAAYDQSGAG